MEPAVFLDRDQTLIANHGDLGDPELVRLLPGVPEGLRALRRAGFRLVVVTNQGGVARGKYTEDDVDRVHERIARLVDERAGERELVDRFYYCPYHPDAVLDEYRREHPWRKPNPGMLLQAARDMKLDLGRSWMIGDQVRDVTAGRAAGCRTILITDRADLADEARPSAAAGDFVDAVRVILRHAERRPDASRAADAARATPERPASPPDDPTGTSAGPPASSPTDADGPSTAPPRGRPESPGRDAAGATTLVRPPVAPEVRTRRVATPPPAGGAAIRPQPPASTGPSPGSERDRTRRAASKHPDGRDAAIDELRRAVHALTEEMRAERLERLDFGPFILAAGLVQLLAVLLALLGLLQPAGAESFMKWMTGAGLAQLLVIALLLMDRRG